MRHRHKNKGLRKLCDCARRNWSKCPDAWYFNFKPRGGRAYQFSLDAELGYHIKTKEEAEAIADRLRGEIRAGTFVRASERRQAAAVPAVTADAVTLEVFSDKYLTHKVKPSGKATWTNDQHMLAQLAEFQRADGSRLGDAGLGTITEDDLEAFHASLRAKGRAASTLNQYVQVLKDAFRWATKKGYLTRNPITEDAALKRSKIAQRSRRLVADVYDKDGKLKTPGEERRLLEATTKNPGMQRLIIAALETGARRGELLALQWAQVDLKRGELTIKGETAKDAETRVLPISTRLAGVLTMATIDPAGKEYAADAYVFGDCGQHVKNVKHAWGNACTRAGLTDLHFHDLRHEAASRWLEAGWPIHHVQEMLGHANVSQTSTYLNAGRLGLRDSMQRFDPARCKPVVSHPTEEHPTDHNGEAANDQHVTVK
jgi:integrase